MHLVVRGFVATVCAVKFKLTGPAKPGTLPGGDAGRIELISHSFGRPLATMLRLRG